MMSIAMSKLIELRRNLDKQRKRRMPIHTSILVFLNKKAPENGTLYRNSEFFFCFNPLM